MRVTAAALAVLLAGCAGWPEGAPETERHLTLLYPRELLKSLVAGHDVALPFNGTAAAARLTLEEGANWRGAFVDGEGRLFGRIDVVVGPTSVEGLAQYPPPEGTWRVLPCGAPLEEGARLHAFHRGAFPGGDACER